MQTADELERGRDAYARSAWSEAYELLGHAERAAPLSGSDLVLLATAAHMLGLVDEWLPLLERAHHTYAEEGEALPAVRCAFWIGMNLALRGEMGPATGWLGRAQRLLEREEGECVEQGYMLLPVSFQHEMSGDFDGAAETAAAAAEIGERFGDSDLFALAVHVQGAVLAKGGRVAEGLSLLDEAMVAVTAGEVAPVVSGIVYCGVILACEEVYELRRAHEWTAALTRWCEQQPDLVSFRGRCLVHRAQLLRLHGDWPAALEEARLAGERFAEAMNPGAIAKAWYLQGEVHRLSGRFAEAESRRTGRRAVSVWNRSLDLRSSGLRRGRGRRRPRRFGGPRARRPIARRARACCRRTSRSCSRPATSTRRGTPAASCARSRLNTGQTCSGPWSRRLAARSSSPQAMRVARWSACGRRSRPGRSSRLLTRSRSHVCSWGERAVRSATRMGSSSSCDAARSALRAARRSAVRRVGGLA